MDSLQSRWTLAKQLSPYEPPDVILPKTNRRQSQKQVLFPSKPQAGAAPREIPASCKGSFQNRSANLPIAV
jgi:hypothetical protein